MRVKSFMIAAMLSIAGFCVVPTIYAQSRFLPNSYIEKTDVSGMSFSDAKSLVEKKHNEIKTFELSGRDGQRETIDADQINYQVTVDVEEAINQNKAIRNPLKLFSDKEYSSASTVKFDELKLKERLQEMPSFQEENMTKPENARIVYENEYRIQKETDGNYITMDALYEAVKKSLYDQTQIIIISEAAYEKAELTMEAEELNEKFSEINQLASSAIVYNVGPEEIQLDHSIFHEWIDMDTKEINKDAVASWVKELAKETDTAYTTRTYQLRDGEVTVTGPYGYRIDQEKETEQILADIKKGEITVREPVYAQTAASRIGELGETFVTIDLTNQHVCLYQNGEVVKESDCVTGNVSAGNATPAGIYPLTYKQKDAVLRGPGYASPVSYWMPFNKGIGLHDASWRSKFGGNIYKTNGSHGCINLPKDMAAAIYEAAYQGMPVICYE